MFCLFLDDNIYCCAWKLWSGLLNGTCHAWPSPHKWRPGESSQHPSTSIREEKHKCWHSWSPMLVPNNTLLSIDDKYKIPRLYQPHPRSKVVGLHLASCHLRRAVNNPWHCHQRYEGITGITLQNFQCWSHKFASCQHHQLHTEALLKGEAQLWVGPKPQRDSPSLKAGIPGINDFQVRQIGTFDFPKHRKQTIYASQTWSFNKPKLSKLVVECLSKKNTKYI